MSKATYLKFYSKGKEGRELSTFSELSVIINGILYKTGEHAFQGSIHPLGRTRCGHLDGLRAIPLAPRPRSRPGRADLQRIHGLAV